ncbi:MAG TPA: tetratricopeptide repeat protein [Candidatus Acidoferrales bacterium]|nr:tetratricopeptide repeat protein [Candidatus Acidoferrales bacterium]
MMRPAALAASFLSLAGLLFAPVARSMPQGSTLEQARTEAAQGHYQQAARLFGEVLTADPNNIDALRGRVDSLVATGHWHDCLPALEHLVQLQPDDAERIFQLGQMDSWQPGRRAQALELLKHATELKPADVQYQDAYAEVLSWSKSGRAQALEYYKKALATDPNNAAALAGEAQLLAWSGRSSEAMELYEKVLQQDPNNIAALRGKAEILDWRGRRAEAMSLYKQAHGLAPDDAATMLGLAQTEYESDEYAQAREDLAEVKGLDTPEFRDLQRNVNHALGTYVEVGYGLRRDGKILDYDSVDALVSTPLGGSNRLSALYQPFLFRTQARNFNSNYYALMLDSQPDERIATHAQIAARTYPGVSSQLEGAFDATFKVRPSFKLYTGVERESDQESLVSTLGAATNGIFVGQVETNLGHIGGSYSNSQHNYDLSLTYTDGAYTGQHLASNRRWGVDGNFGKSIRGNHPYIRIAYGISYLSFDHDADFTPGSGEPVRVTGGYYSPTRFLLNYGQIFLSTNLGRHAKWDMGGLAGAQNAETTFTAFSNTQFASAFSTHLTWNMTENNDLRLGYDYLNTFNAFHRHLFFVAWRHYF